MLRRSESFSGRTATQSRMLKGFLFVGCLFYSLDEIIDRYCHSHVALICCCQRGVAGKEGSTSFK